MTMPSCEQSALTASALGRAGERIGLPTPAFLDFPVAQLVKNLPAMLETWIPSLDWEDPLEKGMAPHSSILAWRIPWAGYSPWGRKSL